MQVTESHSNPCYKGYYNKSYPKVQPSFPEKPLKNPGEMEENLCILFLKNVLYYVYPRRDGQTRAKLKRFRVFKQIETNNAGISRKKAIQGRISEQWLLISCAIF